MDDDAKEILKMGVEVTPGPLADVFEDFLGVLGGDRLREFRRQQLLKLRRRTEELRAELGAQSSNTAGASPGVVYPILIAAQDEGDDRLLEIWARLLLAAAQGEARKSLSRSRRPWTHSMRRFSWHWPATRNIAPPHGTTSPLPQNFGFEWRPFRRPFGTCRSWSCSRPDTAARS